MPPIRLLAALLALLAAAPMPCSAASKRKIAVIGDAAPGDGAPVFAGPSFGNDPSAAGEGWIAFRGQVTGSGSREQIVAQNARTGAARTVATLGETISDAVGDLKQFLGRPAINAAGDVAFVATLSPGKDTPPPTIADPVLAGVFVKRGDAPLEVVALSNENTTIGPLDVVTPVNLTDENISATDIPERTPAIDDAGTVAFLGSAVSRDQITGALFVRPVGQPLGTLVAVGDGWGDGRFLSIGPPVMDRSGTLAFHGFVDGGTSVDGIFRIANGAMSLVVTTPFTVLVGDPEEGDPDEQTVFEITDVIAMNAAGDIAFTGGPIFETGSGGDDITNAIFVRKASEPDAIPTLVSWPGQTLRRLDGSRIGRVSDFRLTSEFGSDAVPPGLAADGTLVFHAVVNGGVSGVLLRVRPPSYELVPSDVLAELGGSAPSETPIGGTYLAAVAAPAVDAAGGVVVPVRIAGGSTGEALLYLPVDGPGIAVRIGDAVPGRGRGYYGGPPFSPPKLNEGGTVVFKSYVARGSSPLGIFRTTEAGIEAIARAGDVAPTRPGASPARFADFPGEPSLNAAGAVTFVATLDNGRRGLYLSDAQGVRVLAVSDQAFPDPQRANAEIGNIGPNPVVRDDGTVIFRGQLSWDDEFFPDELDTTASVLFAADGNGVRLVAVQGDATTTDLPFFRFRDPTVSGNRVAFRAALGHSGSIKVGVFVLEADGTVRMLAIEDQPLSDGSTLGEPAGRPALDADGRVAFLANVRGGRSGKAVVRSGDGVTMPVAVEGDAGPFGGQFRQFGRPTMNGGGDLLFRASYLPFTGGRSGLLLQTPDHGLQPLVSVDDAAPASVGGHFIGVNQNASINAKRTVAFIGSLGGTDARSGIFLASPATLAVSPIRIDLREPGKRTLAPKDSLRIRGLFQPGTTSDGLQADAETIQLRLRDSQRELWRVTLDPGSLVPAKRGGYRLKRRSGKVRAFSLRPGKDRTFRIAFAAAGLDLSFLGSAMPEPPFSLRLEIGDDSAVVTATECKGKPRRRECRGA